MEFFFASYPDIVPAFFLRQDFLEMEINILLFMFIDWMNEIFPVIKFQRRQQQQQQEEEKKNQSIIKSIIESIDDNPTAQYDNSSSSSTLSVEFYINWIDIFFIYQVDCFKLFLPIKFTDAAAAAAVG